MDKVKELDKLLYKYVYAEKNIDETKKLWFSIKAQKDVLLSSSDVIKDKFNEGNLVKGLTICDLMLKDYKNVDNEAYLKLFDAIYNDEEIARIVMEGAANGGYSYLLMSLWNFELKLTQKEKDFAVDQAMELIGTTRYYEKRAEFLKELEEKGVTDKDTVMMDLDGMKTPIGAKAFSEYMGFMFMSMSPAQAHGRGAFDLRYHILRNPNWTKEEKQKLVMDFYSDVEAYEEALDEWEWAIINDNYELELDKTELIYYTYEDIYKLSKDASLSKKIIEEIEFCRLMHEIRPCEWEKDLPIKKLV